MNLVWQLIKPMTEFETVFTEFPSITQPNILDHPIKHDVTHHIKTNGPPVHSGAHRLPLKNLKLLVKSSNICYNCVSSSTHLATGPHLFIWFPKRHQGIVETTESSIMSPFPTIIPSRTFTINFFCYLTQIYYIF